MRRDLFIIRFIANRSIIITKLKNIIISLIKDLCSISKCKVSSIL